MDNSDTSSREGSENISPLVEDLSEDLPNGDWPANSGHLISQLDEKVNDSYGSQNNELTLCKAENSIMDVGTVDKAWESAVTSSACKSCLENFALNNPKECDLTNSISESQEASKQDVRPLITNTQPSKDILHQQTEDGPQLTSVLERVSGTEEAIEGSHRLAEAKPTVASSESCKSQESDSNVTGQEDDALLVKDDTYGKDVPLITVEETDPQNKQELECNHTHSYEFGTNEKIKCQQVRVERELNLEEFVNPIEATLHEDGKLTEEMSNAIMEELSLVEVSTHKVCAQTHETANSVPPVSIEVCKSETFESAQAKTIHHVNELRAAVAHDVPVEFSNFQPSNNEFPTNKRDQVLIKESELNMVQPIEMTELIPRLESNKGEFVKVSAAPIVTSYKPEAKHVGAENLISSENLPPHLRTKTLNGFSDDKENKIPPCAETNSHDASRTNKKDCANAKKELNPSEEELDFDTKYAILVGKILPGHEIYYMPSTNSNRKQVTFRRGGTLDQQQLVSGSAPLWDAAFNIMSFKSATLEAPRRTRHRLQPKPAVNDDHLFPDSVTPSKVEKALIEDDTGTSNEEGNRYDVPFMDDDAFLPKRYRSVVMVEDDSSSESDYSDERRILLGTEHLAEMDETSSHIGLATIDGKRDIGHESGSRWTLGLSICGCLRRRR